jgi:hypothetical protein
MRALSSAARSRGGARRVFLKHARSKGLEGNSMSPYETIGVE